MNDFVWILAADKNASFGKSGVSGSYIIPQGDMKISPDTLSGNRLWVLLRGNEDRAFLSVKIKKIERIIEGYYRDDFLASVDLLSSFRLVSKYSEAANYIIKRTESFSIGVSEINKNDSSSLSQMVIQNIQVKLATPPIKSLSGVNMEILPRSSQSLAKAALRLAVTHLNLDEIWAAGAKGRLNAFPNFANTLITHNVSPETYTGVEEFLKVFDPLNDLSKNQDETSKDLAYTKLSSPKVDTDFTEVEPEKIYAREFVSSGDKFRDLEAALNKTGHAEKIHQEMLKDIAEFLISKGVTPYESGSIDLMYQSKNKLKVCEIKSTTLDNLLAQSSKGAFQLTCYIEELAKNYDDTLPQLILRKIGNEEMESYVESILLRMSIPVLYYDPNKYWPNKLPGLLS